MSIEKFIEIFYIILKFKNHHIDNFYGEKNNIVNCYNDPFFIFCAKLSLKVILVPFLSKTIHMHINISKAFLLKQTFNASGWFTYDVTTKIRLPLKLSRKILSKNDIICYDLIYFSEFRHYWN